MTLIDLKNRAEEQGFNYSYGLFTEPTEPPHLIALVQNSNNFGADNKVYARKSECALIYTFLRKDLVSENKIENEILGDIYWEKTSEIFIKDENCWQVSYYFELEEK